MTERGDTLRTACKDFEEDLVLYYYGDGSAAERSRVEGHLQELFVLSGVSRRSAEVAPARWQSLANFRQSFWDNYYQ